MGQHRKEADRGTDGCRKSGSERTHITCKHEEIVSEYVEDTSGKHRSCCKRRVLVISQVCGKHLIEQEERDRKFDREHILSSQSERIVLCAEHDQELPVKQDYDQPDDCRRQILKLDRFDLSIQKIHFSHPPVIHLLKQKTG